MKHRYIIILLSIIIGSNLHAADRDEQQLTMIRKYFNANEILERLKNGTYEVEAPISYYEKTALHYACELNCIELVKALIQKGANVNVQSRMNRETPLHDAAYRGHYDVVRILLEAGANKKNKTCHGETPADFARKGASDKEFPDIVQLLNDWEKASDIKELEHD